MKSSHEVNQCYSYQNYDLHTVNMANVTNVEPSGGNERMHTEGHDVTFPVLYRKIM